MSIESQTLQFINKIIELDDEIVEKSFDDFIKVFDFPGNFDQAMVEKIAYCRANNLTEDDLIEENKISEEAFEDELKDLSPVKKKLFKHIFDISCQLNNKIIEKGLYPKVNVRVEKTKLEAEIPKYAHEIGDSGADIKVLEDIVVPPQSSIIMPTGLKVVVPLGYEIQIRPRSGNSLKQEYLYLTIANSPGTIDANFRNEMGVILKNTGTFPIYIQAGTKIAQAVMCPVVLMNFIEVDDINQFPTERKGGFGSTGA